MGKGYRKGRLGEEIKKVISDMLLRGQLKDPRLSGMVSITAVDAAPDGSFATVYLSVFSTDGGDPEERETDVLSAMQSCKGTIKRQLGQKIKMRHVPELAFKIDSSMEYGRHMDELIDRVVKKDED